MFNVAFGVYYSWPFLGSLANKDMLKPKIHRHPGQFHRLFRQLKPISLLLREMKYLFHLSLLLLPALLAGQSLEGTVVEKSTGQPIPFATISVFSGEQLLDGSTATEEGHFRQKLPRGATHLEVSFLSYKSVRLDLPLESPIQIQLQEHGSLLDEVTVTAERTTTELKVDRKVINIGADLQQVGTSALEAFNQIAEVQVDYGGGRLSLRASGNVKLLINGKPSTMTPMEVLDQLPANLIDRVEIINAPSAREQANGLAGIINVITKKEQDDGFNLALNGSIGAHPNSLGQQHSLGANGNLRSQKTNFRFLASRIERSHTADNNIERTYADGTGMNIFTPHKFDGSVTRAEAGIDLFLSKKSQLSFDLSYNDNRHDYDNLSAYSGLPERADYEHLRASSHFHRTGTAGVNYLRTFEEEEHTLEFDYQFTRNTNDYPAFDEVDELLVLNENFYQANDLHALALDFVRPLNEIWTMETGIAWNGRYLDSNHDYAPAAAPGSFASFKFRENIGGLYGQLQFKKGKLNGQFGLRVEHFQRTSSGDNLDEKIQQSFTNLFPTLHLTYTTGENTTLSLGASRRISHPNFHYLNPFQITNPFFRLEGNPALKPELSNNLELNLQQKGDRLNWSCGLFIRLNTDVIQRLDRSEENAFQVISYINAGQSNAYGIELNGSYPLASFWDLNISGNYYLTQLEDDVPVTWTKLYQSTAQLKNTWTINKTFTTDLTYHHSPKRQDASRYILPRHRLDWALRARLKNKRLTVGLRVVDLLNDNLQYRTTIAPGLVQQDSWRTPSLTRHFLLSFGYGLFGE